MTYQIATKEDYALNDYDKVQCINKLLKEIIEIEKSMNNRLFVDVNGGEYLIELKDVFEDIVYYGGKRHISCEKYFFVNKENYFCNWGN